MIASPSTAAGEMTWDAVVLGAGPAGAVAARQLALAGRRVLLVDKARLPRDKVCGGCLGGAALAALGSIGLGDLPRRCGGVPLGTFELATARGAARIEIGRRVALSRHALDQSLVAAAAEAGAVVQDETHAALAPPAPGPTRHVVLHQGTCQTTVDARVVIVATGLAGCAAQGEARVAASSYVGLGAICSEPPVLISPGTLLMACTSRGYVGITEIEGGEFDLAAAVDPRALAAASSAGQLVQSMLAEASLEPSCDLTALPWRGTLPLTRRAPALASHRCLLVGDAARYVEPFTGEGIGWAIHSAILAANLTAAYTDPGDPAVIARWPSLYRAALGRQQRNCQAACRALRLDAVRTLLSRGLRWSPSLGRAVTARLDRPLAAPTF